MRKFKKVMTGAAVAALATFAAASPAHAQYYDRDYYDDDDIDIGDVAAGVAIVGGIAVAIDAITDDDDRGDYYDRYGRYDRGYGRYGGGEQASINACARAAQRYGGRVQITDVDQRGYGRYRVRGRTYVRDYDDGRWGRGYDYDRESFTCYADRGRVYEFRI